MSKDTNEPKCSVLPQSLSGATATPKPRRVKKTVIYEDTSSVVFSDPESENDDKSESTVLPKTDVDSKIVLPPQTQSGTSQIQTVKTQAQSRVCNALISRLGNGPILGYSGKRFYFHENGVARTATGGASWFPQWSSLVAGVGYGAMYSPLAYIVPGTSNATRTGNTIKLKRIIFKITCTITRAKIGGANPPVTDFAASTPPNPTGTNNTLFMEAWPKYRFGIFKVPFNIFASTPGNPPPQPFVPMVMGAEGPSPASGVQPLNPYIIPSWSLSGGNISNQPHLLDTFYRNPISDPEILGELHDIRKWDPYEALAWQNAQPFATNITLYPTIGGVVHNIEYDLHFKDHIVTYNPNDASATTYPVSNDVLLASWSNEVSNTMAALQLNTNVFLTGFVEFEDADNV